MRVFFQLVKNRQCIKITKSIFFMKFSKFTLFMEKRVNFAFSKDKKSRKFHQKMKNTPVFFFLQKSGRGGHFFIYQKPDFCLTFTKSWYFRDTSSFFSINHPTNILYLFYFKQISKIIGIKKWQIPNPYKTSKNRSKMAKIATFLKC